eukprot:10415229-Prorocentrum_lima.AAC.1
MCAKAGTPKGRGCRTMLRGWDIFQKHQYNLEKELHVLQNAKEALFRDKEFKKRLGAKWRA